jgi:hypothetical protein
MLCQPPRAGRLETAPTASPGQLRAPQSTAGDPRGHTGHHKPVPTEGDMAERDQDSIYVGRDEVFAGKDLNTKVIEVDRKLVDDYMRRVGRRNPWYEGSTPERPQIAPAALLYFEPHRLKGWIVEGCNIPRNNSARWEFYAPIHLGDRLTVTGHIDDRYVRRNRDHAVVTMLVRNQDDVVVAKATQITSWVAEEAMTPSDVRRVE